ncbi:unnamed protein product [Toxocara canis]|uniref:DNA replication complex GINS protein PSF3 n=1 Tax=Toxocara canis TaxID=6265 RepID=A0A183UTL1_TOXCA|nr:unnamed protein product [Toxocara canis]
MRKHFQIELPKAFNTLTQQALKANAKSVSLESLNQHFYCFGTHLALTIAGEEGRMLAETLLNTFVQRVGAIRTCSLDGAAKPKKLDSCEKKLYSISVRTERLMDDWTRGSTSDRKRKANLDVYNSLKY